MCERIPRSFNGTPRVAYQDEIGVIAPYRGKHIASKLFQLRLQDFLAQGLTVGTVRTKTLPPSVTYLWFNRLGYKVIARYNDADGRVVMAHNLTVVQNAMTQKDVRPFHEGSY